MHTDRHVHMHTDRHIHTHAGTHKDFWLEETAYAKPLGVGWLSCPTYREEKKLGCELDRCLVSQGIMVHITLDFLEW